MKKQKLFRTGYNRELTPSRGEVNTLPSMTQPDMGYSLREILDRFTNGMALPVAKQYFYEDNDGEDFDAYDETRDPNFGLEDASMRLHEINEDQNFKKHRKKHQSNQSNQTQNNNQNNDENDTQKSETLP